MEDDGHPIHDTCKIRCEEPWIYKVEALVVQDWIEPGSLLILAVVGVNLSIPRTNQPSVSNRLARLLPMKPTTPCDGRKHGSTLEMNRRPDRDRHLDPSFAILGSGASGRLRSG
jgi:hypothetical protein